MGVGRWIVLLTAAAILAALAEKLMPSGPVRQVGRLACALMVLIVLVRPLALRSGGLGIDLGLSGQTGDELAAELSEQRDQITRPIIEQKLSAYISDKAAELGCPCRIRVYCISGGEGVWLPDRAQVSGGLPEGEFSKVADLIAAELGVAPEKIDMQSGGEG